ncbi:MULTISPECIES: efflux RND transporter permease subunit [unclassified Oceanobacter]|uniref:efflux RND transporter permease subunit n=1 Tax=unclassified Oceanobacter TaxID=2620260 RepID=UPI002734E286|nr:MULTISPECIES: efflux RND transporter permease subunit [unclassified Oceanobacter]MDP2607828.1 efflux RND transporter permease subunit [Oceanobacter sp. 1_MG-2023]MDP2610988.1 efflux RND transporter permease subunit [Oceanobacter sp. 2_MG-2023]
MIAKFFINRPVFAWVISIIIMLFGLQSILSLPVAQYPSVSPPTVKIDATYTGASAETVENSVTQIIEQQLTGLDGLLYFSSSSSSDGDASIDVTFEQGTDPDMAQVQVQNKVSQITSSLPDAVQDNGVTVKSSQSSFLLIASVYDTTDSVSGYDISDYIASNMQDSIARIEGVGSTRVFGAQYAMRIWLDPIKLANYELMTSDVTSAISAQNVQIAAGNIGAQPAPAGQELNATVTAQSMLQTAEQFRNIIIKSDSSGALVTLGDVARVERGSESYSYEGRLDRHPSSGMAVLLSPGANALDTAVAVKEALAKLATNFPTGWDIAYPKDSTDFITVSIAEVEHTLFEAIILVIAVIYLFLGSWRATLIPAVAVPVVLLGTFGVMAVFGYSINTLTMLALVLSIGLLVDDAIVVVENVERLMAEKGLSPRQATIESMKEISTALIGIAVVLSAVFLPMAFFGGSTGVIYRQFSVTIVSSMILSVIVALTLTPTLCATLLKPTDHGASQRGFFGWFNRKFDAMNQRYRGNVAGVIRRPLRWMLGYCAIIAVLAFSLMRLPTGFLPSEDQAEIMVMFNLPTGASLPRTAAVAREIEDYFLDNEADNVKHIFAISGFSFAGSGQNTGMAFVALKHWDERTSADTSANAIIQRARASLSTIRDANFFILSPPSIRGLGQSNGFTYELLAAPGTSREELITLKDQLIQAASASDQITGIRLSALSDTPQLQLEIDQAKAVSLGVSLSDVSSTLSTAWAGSYVNDFIDNGRVKKVYVQGDSEYRAKPDDLQYWFVRGSDNEMTPFSAFTSSYWSSGPQTLSRYNGFASYEIEGAAASGASSGDAMDEMEALTSALGGGANGSWSGLSYQERLSSGQSTMLYAISILVVFLALAALYESWSVPIAVIMVVPLGVLGSVLAATFRGLENDIYFQVALLTTIGLASKNAILIVEFAEDAYMKGKGLVESAVEGAFLRLRPILMTSLAFIFGTLPLALSSGAGGNSRNSIGTGIVGGTFSATVLALFFVPLFFVLVRGLFPSRKRYDDDDDDAAMTTTSLDKKPSPNHTGASV